MSLKNQSDQKRYVFPARAVLALQADADGNVGKTFSLNWRQFIEAAKGRAPIDEETIYALELFSQIQFRLSAEVWGNFEGLLARAENRSGQSGAFVFSDGTPAYEGDAELYFDALYASKNTSSQTPAQTLRMIAKYLFAVRNLPVGRAFRFATNSNDGVIPPQPHSQLHLKALDKIWVHWNAWRAAEKASGQVEFPLVVWNGTTQQKDTRTFCLHWHRLIEEAQAKHPLDKETRDALTLFNKIRFNVSKETFEQLEAIKNRAKQLSETPSSTVETYGDREEEIAVGKYFYALYSWENHDSQVAPTTLRKIAKYLFAVCHFPDKALDFATALDFPLDANIYSDSVPDNLLRQIHWKASDKIRTHWLAFNDQGESPQPLEYAQAPEAPIQPAEPLETPDMDALMRRAFAAFEEGKPLAEAGMVVCDAFGLREVYEEQLKDPKNRAILAIGETILRALQTVLRSPTTPEKPFVMSTPVVPPTQAPSNPMSDVVKGMIEKQQQREAAKKAEIDAAYRQRDEQIRQAKAIADAECQDALERINRGDAKNKEEGAWLPLVGNATQGANMAQILAHLKAKADEQHELSEKIREQFAGKGDDPIEKLRKRIVYGKNNDN